MRGKRKGANSQTHARSRHETVSFHAASEIARKPTSIPAISVRMRGKRKGANSQTHARSRHETVSFHAASEIARKPTFRFQSIRSSQP